jgi:hypothetical protein
LSWCPLLFLSPFPKELDSLSSSAAFASFARALKDGGNTLSSIVKKDKLIH